MNSKWCLFVHIEVTEGSGTVESILGYLRGLAWGLASLSSPAGLKQVSANESVLMHNLSV